MPIIKVTANTRASAIARAIAGSIREAQTVEVRAIGATAVNQMVKAIVIARRFLSAEGITTACEPDMVILTIDEVERTAIRFTVSAQDAPLVPHREETLP